MQNMVRKIPLLTQEAAPIQAGMLMEFQKRYFAKLKEVLD
jgi:hypothetical protein